jgi:hypothetical protein
MKAGPGGIGRLASAPTASGRIGSLKPEVRRWQPLALVISSAQPPVEPGRSTRARDVPAGRPPLIQVETRAGVPMADKRAGARRSPKPAARFALLTAVLAVLISVAAVAGAWTIPHRPARSQAAAFPVVPTVGALLVKGHAKPLCTASVVRSTRGDVLLTAAHCLGRTLRRNMIFAPAYFRGRAPLGTWEVIRQIVPPGWFPRHAYSDVNIDFAFLIVRGDVQRLTGAEIVGSSSPVPARVRVVGYVNQGKRYLIACIRRPETIMVEGERQLKFVCDGYVGASSGAPFLVGKTVVGVLGGYEEGGISRSVSYSSPFGSAIRALYRQVR